MAKTYFNYLEINAAKLFTVVCLPLESGKFPTVIIRYPYVDAYELTAEEEICQSKLEEYRFWLDSGSAVVFQHCRGRGKSSGDCIPYIHEREDGLFCSSGSGSSPSITANYTSMATATLPLRIL